MNIFIPVFCCVRCFNTASFASKKFGPESSLSPSPQISHQVYAPGWQVRRSHAVLTLYTDKSVLKIICWRVGAVDTVSVSHVEISWRQWWDSQQRSKWLAASEAVGHWCLWTHCCSSQFDCRWRHRLKLLQSQSNLILEWKIFILRLKPGKYAAIINLTYVMLHTHLLNPLTLTVAVRVQL